MPEYETADPASPHYNAGTPGYYDKPEEYWQNEGKHMIPFAPSSPVHQRQEAAISAVISDPRFRPRSARHPDRMARGWPDSIFEAGCGRGRLANFFANDPTTALSPYFAIDVGLDQIESTRAWRPDAYLEQQSLLTLGEIIPLPSDWPNQYDLVVVSEVLMHIPPGDLDRALNHLIRLVTKEGRLLIVEWVPDEANARMFRRHPEMVALHNWPHNYLQHLSPLGVDLLHSVRTDQQMLYYLSVR